MDRQGCLSLLIARDVFEALQPLGVVLVFLRSPNRALPLVIQCGSVLSTPQMGLSSIDQQYKLNFKRELKGLYSSGFY